jgi:hypothetical protein
VRVDGFITPDFAHYRDLREIFTDGWIPLKAGEAQRTADGRELLMIDCDRLGPEERGRLLRSLALRWKRPISEVEEYIKDHPVGLPASGIQVQYRMEA